MASRKLTVKQQAFVAEYLVDLCGAQAAIRAGYSENTATEQASRLLTNVKVAAAIAEAQAKRAERTEVSQDYVLNNLVEVVERCMQKRPVCNAKGEQVNDEDGNNLWSFNAQGANKGLELLGRHLGMFKEQHEHTGKNGGPIPVEHNVSAAVAAMLKNLHEVTQ